MGIREFYAQHMNRPGFEYIPDPLGRLGQGQWKKTAQGPQAPTPSKPPVAPKPVPPTRPKGAPSRNRKSPGRPKQAKRYRLKDGIIVDEYGNPIDPNSVSPDEWKQIYERAKRDLIREILR